MGAARKLRRLASRAWPRPDDDLAIREGPPASSCDLIPKWRGLQPLEPRLLLSADGLLDLPDATPNIDDPRAAIIVELDESKDAVAASVMRSTLDGSVDLFDAVRRGFAAAVDSCLDIDPSGARAETLSRGLARLQPFERFLSHRTGGPSLLDRPLSVVDTSLRQLLDLEAGDDADDSGLDHHDDATTITLDGGLDLDENEIRFDLSVDVENTVELVAEEGESILDLGEHFDQIATLVNGPDRIQVETDVHVGFCFGLDLDASAVDLDQSFFVEMEDVVIAAAGTAEFEGQVLMPAVGDDLFDVDGRVEFDAEVRLSIDDPTAEDAAVEATATGAVTGELVLDGTIDGIEIAPGSFSIAIDSNDILAADGAPTVDIHLGLDTLERLQLKALVTQGTVDFTPAAATAATAFATTETTTPTLAATDLGTRLERAEVLRDEGSEAVAPIGEPLQIAPESSDLIVESAGVELILSARGPPSGAPTPDTAIATASTGAIGAHAQNDAESNETRSFEALATDLNLALAAIAMAGRIRDDRKRSDEERDDDESTIEGTERNGHDPDKLSNDHRFDGDPIFATHVVTSAPGTKPQATSLRPQPPGLPSLAADSRLKTRDSRLSLLSAPARGPPATAVSDSHLVIVDPSVDGSEALLDGIDLEAGEFEIAILDAGRDGVEQITELLSRLRDLDSIHILSHGGPGVLRLGGTVLTGANLADHAAQLRSWRGALAEGADLLLYGCRVAAGGRGVEFAHDLAAVTGADIAASADLTGAVSLGGNWTLEHATGPIEATSPFDTDRFDDRRVLLPIEEEILYDTPLATFDANPTLTAPALNAFVDGLTLFATLLDALDTAGEINTSVPGAIDAIPNPDEPVDLLDLVGDIDLPTLFQQYVVDWMDDFLATGSTIAGVESFLDTLPGPIFSGLDFTVNGFGGALVDLGGGQYEYRFSLSLDIVDNDVLDGFLEFFVFDLGRAADLLGLELDSGGAIVDVDSASYSLDMSFGTILTIVEGDFDGEADVADIRVSTDTTGDFFIRNTDWSARIDIPSTAVNQNLRVGFLNIAIAGGTYALDGGINVAVTDPAPDGRVTWDELGGTPAGDLVEFTPVGTLTGTFPVVVRSQVTLPSGLPWPLNFPITVDTGFDTNFGGSYQLDFSGVPFDPAAAVIPGTDDPRSAPQLDPNGDFEADLLPFTKINGGDVIALLGQVIQRLEEIRASDIFDQAIPFAADATLADVLPIADALSNQLIFNNADDDPRLVDAEQNPLFDSAQELGGKLAQSLGVSVFDVPAFFTDNILVTFSPLELTYHVPPIDLSFVYDFDPETAGAQNTVTDVPITLDLDVDTLGDLQSETKLTLTPEGTLEFTFGIQVTDELPMVSLAPPIAAPVMIALVDENGIARTPPDGRLSGDAVFDLIIGGVGTARVSVLQSAETEGTDPNLSNTDDNTGIADLVADIEVAINHALCASNLPDDPQDIIVVGSQLLDPGLPERHRLTLAAPGTTFLGVETNDAKGLALDGGITVDDLGFIDGQEATVAPTPLNGVLSGDAMFDLKVGEHAPVPVTVSRTSTTNNANAQGNPRADSLDELVADIQEAIDLALGGITEAVRVIRAGEAIAIVSPDPEVDTSIGATALHVTNLNDVTLRDLGYREGRIGGRIDVPGRSEMVIDATGPAPASGMPGDDVTLAVSINGGDPIAVTVLQTSEGDNKSNTSDNDVDGAPGDTIDEEIRKLVVDVNAAIAFARIPDADGNVSEFSPSLGTVVSAGAVDSDGDEVLDRLLLRSVADIDQLQLVSGGRALLGFSPAGAVSIGPPADGVLDGDATFSITLGGTNLAAGIPSEPVFITVPDDVANEVPGDPEASFLNLLTDVTAQVAGAFPGGEVITGRIGRRIVLAATPPSVENLRIGVDEDTVAGRIARDQLGLEDGFVGKLDDIVNLFIEDTSLTAGVELAVSDSQGGTARYGFVGIDFDGPTASVSADLAIDFLDNDPTATDPGRIPLDDIGNRVVRASAVGMLRPAIAPSYVLSGDATFDLVVAGTTANVTVSLTDPDGEPDPGDPESNPLTGTDDNTSLADLVADVQVSVDAALVAAGLRPFVSVGSAPGAIVLSASALETTTLEIQNPDATVAEAELGLVAQTGSTVITVPSFTWTGNATLGNITVAPALDGLTVGGGPVDISIDVTNDSQAPYAPEIQPPDLTAVEATDLGNLSNLLFNDESPGDPFDVLKVLGELSAFLTGTLPALPLIGDDLPLVGRSATDLLDSARLFARVVDDFADNPTAVVQDLSDRLIEALGLPSTGAPVSVGFDPAESVLYLAFTFDEQFVEALPVDLDVAELTGETDPFQLKGAAGLETTGGATIELTVGVDLVNPADPEAFLQLDSPAAFPSMPGTTLCVDFGARAADIAFVGTLGPLGLFVNDGFVVLDEDGAPGGNDMEFIVDLLDPTGSDGRIEFSQLGSVDANVGLVGALQAVLPLFFPTESTFLGNLSFSVPDVAAWMADPANPANFDFDLPDLGNLFDDFQFDLLDNLRLLTDGLDLLLFRLQEIVGAGVSVNLPLIGGALEGATDFIEGFQADLIFGLRDALDNAIEKSTDIIRDAIEAAFGGAPLVTGDGLLLSPIVVTSSLTGNPATDFIQFEMVIGQTFELPIDFDLGLPVFGIESDDPLTVTLGWSIDFGFGLNFQDGFYFLLTDDGGADPEIEVTVELTLPDEIHGNLLFLRLVMTDADDDPNDHPTTFLAQFAVDLVDAGGTDPTKLTLAELGGLQTDVTLNGGVDINLDLTLGINPGGGVEFGGASVLPSIVADFDLAWGFTAIGDPSGNLPTDGLTELAFRDIGLDLGSFFSEFLGPIVRSIQTVTEPIQPLIDVFTAPIPVISDLAGEPFTLIDLAALFGDINPDLIKALADLITLVNTLPSPAPGSNVILPFGDIDFLSGSPLAATGLDFLFEEGGFDDMELGDIPGVGAAIAGFDFGDRIENSGIDGATKDFTKNLEAGRFGAFDLPIFSDPSQLIGLLFKRPAVLITYDLPPLEFDFSYKQFFPIVGPLGVSVTGSVGATFDFAVGFDTAGLEKFAAGGFKYPLDIFRGFYFSDTADPLGTGPDVPEVTVTGSIVGAAELNVGVASAGVGGGIFVTVGFDLNDPIPDGRVHIDEMINNFWLGGGPLGIFDFSVLIEAKLTWFVEVFWVFKASGQIGPSLPLLELEIGFERDPVLATELGGGVLRLNMGDFADDRLHGNLADGDEVFDVSQSGGTVTVKKGSVEQTYDGVTKIIAQAGQGNDVLTFTNVTVPMEIDGGFGDDTIDLSTSSGAATVRGGSGNDAITSGTGNDVLLGEKGRDYISGGPGNDEIDGGEGEDRLSGDGDNDTIRGGPGNDVIGGGAGVDYADGGTGADEIRGDSTVDSGGSFIAPTGEDRDFLSGGPGNDTIRGEGGDDFIGGGPNADTIEGGPGADTIWGDSSLPAGFDAGPGDEPVRALPSQHGADRIFGEKETSPTGNDGGDTIYGEGNNDFIRGNAGDDYVHGGVGADIIYGDDDDDHLWGEADPDIMFGNADDDTMSGGPSNDIMFGDDGLVARLDDDPAAGSIGDSFVEGSDPAIWTLATGFTGDGDPLSRDLIVTAIDVTDGTDRVDGGPGDDIAFGGANPEPNEIVIGDIDPAEITGATPTGTDILFGDGGRVLLENRRRVVAETVDPTDGGIDIIYGSNGDDIAFGGPMGDTINGGHGATHATTATDDDILIGDSGRIDFDAGGDATEIQTTDPVDGGVDTISGNEGEDIAIGGADGDFIFGNLASDILIGDGGRVTFTDTVITLIETIQVTTGGVDAIEGDADRDFILGGFAGDDPLRGQAGPDIIIGDNGRIEFTDGQVDLIVTTDTVDATGGVDFIYGDAGDDIALGGVAGDFIRGSTGPDILVGDNGRVDFDTGDGDLTTVDLVQTAGAETSEDPDLGGADTIYGNDADDLAIGGAKGDLIYGDDGDEGPGGAPGLDILVGDGGKVLFASFAIGRGPTENFVTVITTTDPATGGEDVIEGNELDDVILGGAEGDDLYGEAQDLALVGPAGSDTILGDNGRLDYVLAGDSVAGRPDLAAIGLDTFDLDGATPDPTTLDRITTIDPNDGGRDTILGNGGDEFIFGGTDQDTLYGDTDDLGAPDDGFDVMFGDHGKIYPSLPLLEPAFVNNNFFAIDTAATDGGDDDDMFGNGGDDNMLGQQGDDLMFGGTGNDNMSGGHNIVSVPGDGLFAIDELDGGPFNDIMDGQSDEDLMTGDNAIVVRQADSSSPRYRELVGTVLYGIDPVTRLFFADVTPENQLSPTSDIGNTVILVDHSMTPVADSFGNDAMAGGSEDDVMFGELGDDLMQGDGSIDPAADPSAPVTVEVATGWFFNTGERVTDGDDAIEGNGGGDLIYGDLGRDDIIGGSSAFYGLDTADERPDGADVIFGGAGLRIARNEFVDPAVDPDLAAIRHARDADVILGDNGNIIRPVAVDGGSSSFLQYNWDDPAFGDGYAADLDVIPRAFELLDYGYDPDTGAFIGPPGTGDAETIYGESGDDVIHGMTGRDVIFGDSDDDDVYGGHAEDWISGGTGLDGVLGDDGLLFTSRFGVAEPLYAIEATPPNQLDRVISTPGNWQNEVINVTDALVKTVDLEPFEVGYNDIVYGGLGGDFLHGSAGDDAMSGAEALPNLYAAPVNPGNVLNFGAFDPEEFAAYDEFNPLTKIDGFLLNFETRDGAGEKIHDGDDIIFGDNGNDWLVGGTNHDHLYGGRDHDLLDADDDKDTAGGLNDIPDPLPFADFDRAYGGAGRDVLLANTGADRLIDWVGEFNSYVVPFSPFGMGTVSRTIQPQLRQFLYDLSEAHGADQTRIDPEGGEADRNGEPFGEIALVNMHDDEWQDQTGPPDDPQAGNTPGTQKDVMRFEDFETGGPGGGPGDNPNPNGNATGNPHGVTFAAESGGWAIVDGRLDGTSGAGGEAIAVGLIEDIFPSYMEVLVTAEMDFDPAAPDDNALVIFDYQNAADFKFAGGSSKLNKLWIGHRDATGWIIDATVNKQLHLNTAYEFTVVLDGPTVTLIVNEHDALAAPADDRDDPVTDPATIRATSGAGGRTPGGAAAPVSANFLVHDFEEPLDDGMLGLGTLDSGLTRFDDFTILVLPSPMPYEVAENFDDGAAGIFHPESGTWSFGGNIARATGEQRSPTAPGGPGDLSGDDPGPTNLRYTGTPTSGLDHAISTVAIDVAPGSLLALEATVSTDTFAGLVVDHGGPLSFKFAAVDTATGQLVLGHRGPGGWFTDATLTLDDPVAPGADADLAIQLDGATVIVSFDGYALLQHTYSALLTDGRVGLLTRGGTSAFDDVLIRGSDPAIIEQRADGTMQGTAPDRLLAHDRIVPVEYLLVKTADRISFAAAPTRGDALSEPPIADSGRSVGAAESTGRALRSSARSGERPADREGAIVEDGEPIHATEQRAAARILTELRIASEEVTMVTEIPVVSPLEIGGVPQDGPGQPMVEPLRALTAP